ncbi:RICIN domain-containing protein [Sorangium sp. So ce1014]|uniref:RICIN domain-containing protein n=1 Tax=Sorangium sp. So ce1014 TaxID=3133326 RepID=UPI003F649119
MRRFDASTLRPLIAAPTFCAIAALSGCVDLPEDERFEDEEIASHEEAIETFDSPFRLIPKHSNKCVTVKDADPADGARVWQITCDGADQRKFSLESTGDGYYRLVARHSGKCLNVANHGTSNGTAIDQWTCHDADNQKWKPLPMGNGYFSLKSKQSGKCMEVSNMSTADAAGIRLWDCHGGDNQKFKPSRVETTGNLLYGYWKSSGGQSATSAKNRSFLVDYAGPTRAVTFDLTSPVDTYLYLLDASGNVLAQDNDSGDAANARITLTLSTGTYKLVAATYASGKAEEFAISSNFASLRYPQSLHVQPATEFLWIYDDDGTGADDDVSIWRPDLGQHPGYYSLGDVAMPNHDGAPRSTFVVKGDGDVLAAPLDYHLVWKDTGSGGDHDGSFWEPVAPPGYTCLGHVATGNYTKPSTNLIRCVKSAYVLSGNSAKIWDDAGSGADMDAGIWEATTKSYRGLPTSTFVSRPSHGDDGGAGRYWVLNKSATANEELRGGPVTGLSATMFAPKVTLDPSEAYFPSSAEFFLANVHEDNGFLVTNESLGCNNCTNPAFLDGQRPDHVGVPVYAEIVKRTGTPVDTTDVIYWMFYPYNNGKVVCLLYVDYLFGTTCGYSLRFGNHVGDWEHMTVRFIDGRPADVYLAQHSHGDTFAYGQKHLGIDGWHAETYSAKGSHGLYAETGKHVYRDLPNGDYLADYTGDGIQWQTWTTVVPFEWQAMGSYTGALSFLNKTSRWGNRKSGCDFWEALADECELNDGPEGPMVKGLAAPSSSALE